MPCNRSPHHLVRLRFSLLFYHHPHVSHGMVNSLTGSTAILGFRSLFPGIVTNLLLHEEVERLNKIDLLFI